MNPPEVRKAVAITMADGRLRNSSDVARECRVTVKEASLALMWMARRGLLQRSYDSAGKPVYQYARETAT